MKGKAKVGRKKINKADIYLKNVLRSKKRFCSMVNAVVFKGVNVLKPSMLSSIDTDISAIIGENDFIERRRDIAWLINFHGLKFILGIENQTYIDQSMIVRVGIYDFLQYLAQIIVNRGQGNEKKVYPVITLVLYYGDKPWTPATSIHEYFHFPELFKGLFNNWRYPFCALNDFDYTLFDDEYLRIFVEGIQRMHRWDKKPESLEGWIVPQEIALGIVAVTGNAEMLDFIEKIEGDVNMSQAFAEFVEEAISLGFSQGINQGISQGLSQGLHNGEVKALFKILKKKLGEISQKMKSVLELCTIEELDYLFESIEDIQSEQDIMILLGK